MSKLTDHIKAKVSNRLYPSPPQRPSFVELTQVNIQSYQPQPHLLGIRIEVSIGAEVRAKTGEDTTPHMQHMTRMIEQEVFGEFRTMLYELDQLLFNCDIDGAMRLSEEIRKKMFTA